MISYRFNDKTAILETTIKGDVSIKDLIEYISSLLEDKTLPKVLKIFTDASQGRFEKNVKYEELPKIVEINNKHLQQREIIYDAFILSSSMETALGQLYMELSNADNYFFNIFYSKETAIYWLNKY